MIITEKSYAYPGRDAGRAVFGRARADTVDLSGSGGWNRSGAVGVRRTDFSDGLGRAAERTAEKNAGKVIGLTSVSGEGNLSYGMVAQYASDSTKEDPVIQVTTGYHGERVSFKVHVNEVDPESASALEMFALCCYSDDQGFSDGGTFGSWQKMKAYADNAVGNGVFSDFRDFQSFTGEKADWRKMVDYMMTLYQNAGLYGQSQSCARLSVLLDRFAKNSKRNAAKLTGSTSGKDGESSTEALMKIIAGQKEEILKKIKSGDTGQKIPIGGMSLTQEEWEKLIESFDKAEEAIQEAVKAKQGEELPEKRPDSTVNGNTVLAPIDTGHDLKSLEELVEEAAVSIYPADDGESDTEEPDAEEPLGPYREAGTALNDREAG